MIRSLFTNAKINNSLIRDSIGLVLFLACIYITIFHHYSWGPANQVFFHFPLIVLWYMLFFRTMTMLKAGLLSWVSFALAHYGVLDEKLHEFFLNFDLYPEYAVHEGFVNPQYNKLLLYFISLIMMGILLLFKRKRTASRSFAFISALGCLVATLLIHKAIPFGTLKWERQLAVQNMSSVVKYGEGKNHEQLADICRSFDLTCHMDLTEEKARTLFPTQFYQIQFVLRSEFRTAQFETGLLHAATWYRQVLGIIKNKDKTFNVLVEDKLINQSQIISEESFSRLCSFANLVWGWLFLLIGLLHISPIRKKIFIDSNS